MSCRGRAPRPLRRAAPPPIRCVRRAGRPVHVDGLARPPRRRGRRPAPAVPESCTAPGRPPAGPRRPASGRRWRRARRATPPAAADRSISSPVTRASEVAPGTGQLGPASARSSGRSRRRPPARRTSTRSSRIPPALWSSTSTSLGHFRPTSAPVTRRTALAAAIPASNGSQGQRSAGASCGTSRKETVNELPGGATHSRSRRPRPALWCSAARTRPPALAIAEALGDAALVEAASAPPRFATGPPPRARPVAVAGQWVGACPRDRSSH